MAMGLHSLGRGRKNRYRTISVALLHMLGAVIGGAIVGGGLGLLGTVLSLKDWRPPIIALSVGIALWHSIRRYPRSLGRRRQVPQKWIHVIPLSLCYFLWGALLGSGIATLIPYSSFVVLLGAQFTSGPILGCASGVLFGGVREAVALLVLIRRPVEQTTIMNLLPALAMVARYLNMLWVVAGGLILIYASVGV